MTMAKRFLALVLALLCVLPVTAAFAEGEGVLAGAFKQGAFASEGTDTVYFTIENAGKAGLYSVPSIAGNITLLEQQDDITDLCAVAGRLFYLRSVSGSWQLVCRTAEDVSVVHMFAAGAEVQKLGYYDGILYIVTNERLYAIDPLTGTETLVSEQLLSDYCILGGRIYFISTADMRTYQRIDTENGDKVVSATAGCLYSMALDGSDLSQTLEIGVADLRGYGEYIYFHNYADNYFVASTTDKWLEGRLYRYNIITEVTDQANPGYDWEYAPTGNGLMLYTQNSIDMRMVDEKMTVNLMKPEQFTTVAVDNDFVLVYEHTEQKITRVPTNGEVASVLGSVLPGSVSEGAPDAADGTVDTSATVQPGATTKPAATTKATAKPAATKIASTKKTSGYIFPESDTRKLTKDDLKKVDPTLWAYGRNEIWARHGYKFSKKIYSDYFNGKTWYKEGGYKKSDVSDIEWYNMDFIKKYEDLYADKIAALNAGATSAPTKKPSTTKNPSTTKKPTENTYIFPDSATKKLTKADILAVDRELWAFGRNEIWARHGYKFKNKKFADYFANQKWYKAGGYNSKDVTDIEWYNMELIKKMEQEN